MRCFEMTTIIYYDGFLYTDRKICSINDAGDIVSSSRSNKTLTDGNRILTSAGLIDVGKWIFNTWSLSKFLAKTLKYGIAYLPNITDNVAKANGCTALLFEKDNPNLTLFHITVVFSKYNVKIYKIKTHQIELDDRKVVICGSGQNYIEINEVEEKPIADIFKAISKKDQFTSKQFDQTEILTRA